MRLARTAVLLLMLTACGAEAPAPEPEPPPPPPTYADFAGTWDAVTTLDGVEAPVPSRLESTPAGGGWTMNFEGRDPVPMRASIVGDSLVLLSEPYTSVLRDDVTVQVRTASMLVDGVMTGRVIATYDGTDGQDVVLGTIRAERVTQAPE